MCCILSINSLADIIYELKEAIEDEEYAVVVRRGNILEDAMKPTRPIILNKTMVVCFIKCWPLHDLRDLAFLFMLHQFYVPFLKWLYQDSLVPLLKS